MMPIELDDFLYHHGEDVDSMMLAATTPAEMREAVKEYQRLRHRHEIEWREDKGNVSPPARREDSRQDAPTPRG